MYPIRSPQPKACLKLKTKTKTKATTKNPRKHTFTWKLNNDLHNEKCEIRKDIQDFLDFNENEGIS